MLEVFVGDRLPVVLGEVRRALGDNACVVDVSCETGRVEVLASAVPLTARPFHPAAASVPARPEGPGPESFGAVLREPASPGAERSPAAAGRSAGSIRAGDRPPIIVLVGPTGAGKTTTLAKLATNPLAFGGRPVGLLGLDTYRIGAVEQLETYAELGGLRCQIAYDEPDLDRALDRLRACEIVLVDTPGRGPRRADDLATIRRALDRLAPDEIHLVLPASMMPQLLRRTITGHAPLGMTHLLATKLDECPLDARIFDLAARGGHALRWYTDGQEVPDDLHLAAPRMAQATARLAAHQLAHEVFA